MKKGLLFIPILIAIILLIGCATTDGNTLFGQNYEFNSSSAIYSDKALEPGKLFLVEGCFSDFHYNRLFETEMKEKLQNLGFNVIITSDYPSPEKAADDFINKNGKYYLFLNSIKASTYEHGGGIAKINTEVIVQSNGLLFYQDYMKMAVNVYCTGNEFESINQTADKAIKRLTTGITSELTKYL